MPRIFDFSGREVERSQTVAGLRALKGSGIHAAQVKAETAEEAAAAEAAGIEMVVCRAINVSRVREGSTKVFITAIVSFADAIAADDVLKTAVGAMTSGADAIITSRGFETVRMLADELIPVMGHLGFVPRKSTWVGGIRAVGKSAAEALELWDRFRRLEDAGAFAVECELVPAAVLAEINKRTRLVTVSLGSGADADVIYLFTSDLTGESVRLPRHARSWGRMAELQSLINQERRQALASFRTEVASGSYPSATERASLPDKELIAFREGLVKIVEFIELSRS